MSAFVDTRYVSKEEFDSMRARARVEIGFLLRRGMAAMRVSQETLGNRLGVTQQTLSNWCNGVSSPPPEYWCTIAAILDIDWQEFMRPYLEMERERVDMWL